MLLSLGIPFALVPLIHLTSQHKVMGRTTNLACAVVAGVVTAAVCVLKAVLVYRDPVTGLRLVYETHATTVYNERGLATGWFPGELSAAGVQQARELGARRRDDGLDLVLTSDLHRAVRTAEIAFGGTDIPLVTDPRLRECDYGSLTGGPVTRI